MDRFYHLLLSVATLATAPAGFAVAADDWRPLASHWESAKFGGEGPVEINDGSITLAAGDPLTGVRWTGEFPTEIMRLSIRPVASTALIFLQR